AINRDLAAECFVFEKAFPGAPEGDKAFFAEREGRAYSAPPGMVTFSQAHQVWEKEVLSRILSDNTKQDYRKALEPHILPYFGKKAVDQITEGLVQDFFSTRFKNSDPDQGLVSEKRMANIMIPLVKIWKFTVRARKWDIPSPFEGIKKVI